MLGPTITDMVISWVTAEVFDISKFNKLSVYTSMNKDIATEQ